MIQFNKNVEELVNLKIDSSTRDILNKIKVDTNSKNVNSVILCLIALSEVIFIISKNSVEETIEMIKLPTKLKNGWKIKGIKTNSLIEI